METKIKHYYLDFTGCRHLGEMHRIIKEAFNFPDWYGENWDAFWDFYKYYDDNEMLVHIKGLDTMPIEFDEDIGIMLEIFKEAKDKSPNMKWVIEK